MPGNVTPTERREITQLREALTAAHAKLLEQQQVLAQLTATPLPYGVVVRTTKRRAQLEDFQIGKHVRFTVGSYSGSYGRIVTNRDSDGDVRVQLTDGASKYARIARRGELLPNPDIELVDGSGSAGTVAVAVDGRLLEMVLPQGKTIHPGMTVKIAADTMQIVDVSDLAFHGEVAVARRMLSGGKMEVTAEGTSKIVFAGNISSVKAGDRIVLDPAAVVAIENLGQENKYSFTMTTNVIWEDIGGLEEAKKLLVEAIEFPRKYRSFYRSYGKKPIKGALLYGPPRCGKTMLGKAVATAFAQMNGREASQGFLYVKGPELLNMYVGNTEAAIRQLFAQARQFKEEHGYPAVIFFDEADSLLRKRGSGISSDMEATVVPMFLSEMDGLDESGALILLATNRPDVLDPAITGDKRIDRKIKVDRPDEAAARKIFEIYLGRTLLADGTRVSDLVNLGLAEVFSNKQIVQQVRLGQHKFTLLLKHIINGAMVEAVVDHATSIALERDIKRGSAQGITKDDVIKAVCAIVRENKDLNHQDEIVELVEQSTDSSQGPTFAGALVHGNNGDLNA